MYTGIYSRVEGFARSIAFSLQQMTASSTIQKKIRKMRKLARTLHT